MTERAYTRCVTCSADTPLGDHHCVLCHQSTPRGEIHTCPVLDKVVTDARERDLVAVGPRTPWAPVLYADHLVPKE